MNRFAIKKDTGKEFVLYFNGEKVSNLESKSNLHLSVDGLELIKYSKFSSIPLEIDAIVIDLDVCKKYKIYPLLFDFIYIGREEENFPYITVNTLPDVDNWKYQFSPKELVDYLFSETKKLSKEFSLLKEPDTGLVDVAYLLYFRKKINNGFSIGQNLAYLFETFEQIIANFIKQQKQFSIDTFFSFPEEYKTACEQYLLYFAQFLKDLGIEAKTDLENQENGVLFKVFPKDKEAALTQIKEALAIYLALPAQQNIDEAATQFPDAAVQQLISNVYHLKSQLVLANSTILKLQRQNEALELFQYQEKPIIHLGEFDKNQKNEEKIFGGIVTVKEYEGTGFNIDLPKLFRMMKRIWGK